MRTCLLALLLLSALVYQVGAQSPMPAPTPQDGGDGYMPEDSVGIAGTDSLPSPYDDLQLDKEPIPLNMDAFKANLKYPKDARDAHFEGIVSVRVLVSPRGEYVRYILLKSPHPDLTEEVVTNLPMLKFSPGEAGGKAVYSWVNLPVKFKIEGGSGLYGSGVSKKRGKDASNQNINGYVIGVGEYGALSDAKLVLFDPSGVQLGQTIIQENGMFRFTVPFKEGMFVLVKAWGYDVHYQKLLETGNVVQLEPSKPWEFYDGRIDTQNTIKGLVTTVDNQPLKGVQIVLFINDTLQLAETTTKNDGSYVFYEPYIEGMKLLLIKWRYNTSIAQLINSNKAHIKLQNVVLKAPGDLLGYVNEDSYGFDAPNPNTFAFEIGDVSENLRHGRSDELPFELSELPNSTSIVGRDQTTALVDLGEFRKLLKYPPIAREAGIVGEVCLDILFDSTGKYKAHFIKKSPHPALTFAVEENIKILKRESGLSDEKADFYWVTLSVWFPLEDPRNNSGN